MYQWICNEVKTKYCRLRKSTEHRSQTSKHQTYVYSVDKGKDSSDSSTRDDNFINIKNTGSLWKVSADVFEIFLIVEKYFRCNV